MSRSEHFDDELAAGGPLEDDDFLVDRGILLARHNATPVDAPPPRLRGLIFDLRPLGVVSSAYLRKPLPVVVSLALGWRMLGESWLAGPMIDADSRLNKMHKFLSMCIVNWDQKSCGLYRPTPIEGQS